MDSNILTLIRDLLRFHRAIGIEHVPRTPEIVRFLDQGKPVSTPKTPRAAPPRQRPVKGEEAAREMPSPSPVSGANRPGSLDDIRARLGDCTCCPLHLDRTRILFGTGPSDARLVVVGEWPDQEDEAAGFVFAGAKGELLDKMLRAIGLARGSVYLTNVVKCRASEETPPTPEEVRSCLPFLKDQIAAIAPAAICAMGPLAAHALLGSSRPLLTLRGRMHRFQGIPLVPTFHPSYLLKVVEMKKLAWVDLQLVQKILQSPDAGPPSR